MNQSFYVTKRDNQLLADLHTYGLLSTSQISEKFFKGVAPSTILRRLRILEDGGLIARIHGLERGELGWKVESKGAALVSALPPKKNFHPSFLVHDFRLVEIRQALERENIVGGWVPEHEIRRQFAQAHEVEAMRDRAIPDGLAAMRYRGVMHSVAIELELTYKDRTRYNRIFRRYREKKNILAVWYLVKDETMGKSLARLWRLQGNEGTYIRLIWSVASDVITRPKEAPVYLQNSVHAVGDLFGLADINS